MRFLNFKYKGLYAGLICCLIIYTSPLFAGSLELSWDAPTKNADGGPLTDLAGFKIYYGTASLSYSNSIDVGMMTVYQVNKLTEGVSYYFSVTAYDTSGNESGYSNETSYKILPVPVAPEISVTDQAAPVDDLQMPFGDITVGAPSVQTVTISNNGNADLLIGDIALSDRLMSPFGILNDNCSGHTLGPSSACTLTVDFTPTATGPFSDSFDIPSSDTDENTVTVSLNGRGVSVPVPDIAITDSTDPVYDLNISFGDITEGLSSVQSVTLTNSGNADLIIGDIALSDYLMSPFGILNDNCSGRTLGPSSACTFAVGFSPATTGTFNDTFDVPSNDPDGAPATITVGGRGLSSLSLNPPSMPRLVFPANYQKDLATTVGFRWEKSEDPDRETVSYDLYICEDENFTTGCIVRTDIAYKVDSIYYADMAGYWAVSFLSGIVFLFFSPGRNKIYLTILIMVMTVLLLVSCGGGGGSGGGGGINTYGSATDTSYDEVSQTVSGLQGNAVYFWRVTAKDGEGGEAVSSIWRFQTH